MSFTYSTVGLALGIAKVSGKQTYNCSNLMILYWPNYSNIWHQYRDDDRSWVGYCQPEDVEEFASSRSHCLRIFLLDHPQDTVKSPPAEHKTMKKATSISIAVTTIFYLLCGCIGYAAFGDNAPGNLLTGFGFFDPYWILDIANIAIVVHLVGAYQLNFFRVVWRTCFVVLTTLIAMLLPFFNDVVGILGALGFWPLTVYFPVEMYIAKNKIGRWTNRWIGLQMLSMACLFVSAAAAVGSVAGVVLDLHTYKPFKTRY